MDSFDHVVLSELMNREKTLDSGWGDRYLQGHRHGRSVL